MRNLLALFGALVLLVGGVGWYMGWYTIHLARTGDGNIHIETDFNAKKAMQDTSEKAKEITDVVNEKLDKVKVENQPGAPVNTPGPTTATGSGTTK